ncbi:hypothetical protein BU16DRAFT_556879 [Lophium mytilinum]|uniref:Altered inheritance of mitochondria protein 9, mitochondrial n=1 Tax=Lophium mytilinum TaxID=390894 RepID=A0A6A6R748_9PEZI|nr:hypothetical protein BU16DRAFT_556879 [Lophium mytilinum]
MLGWIRRCWQSGSRRKTQATPPVSARGGIKSNGSISRKLTIVQNSSSLDKTDDNAKRDPYQYTAGHWLSRDEVQHQARLINFDFPKLCEMAVASCPGASKVVQWEKAEGLFNRAFIMHLDNDKKVVARIPFRVVGPKRLTTNSEVATIRYIQASTKIPIPKILDWSDDDSNPTGTEYIIMEHAPGVPLIKKWPFMSPHQHASCVKNLAQMIVDMARLQFPSFGSLYFSDAPIDHQHRIKLRDGFCIGPHCGRSYWDCNVGEERFYEERPANRGPWADLDAFSTGLIDAGFSRIPKADPNGAALPYRGSVQEHLRLLGLSEEVLKVLIKTTTIQDVAAPTLIHPDFHSRNVFVSDEDPTSITAIIDWQSASIEPNFVYADQRPDFAYRPAALLKKDDTFQGVEEDILENTADEVAREMVEKDVSRCIKIFEVMLVKVPKVHASRVMDEALLRVFRYCDGGWVYSAAALRQELIELSKRWKELGLPNECPYQPTPEELAEHEKEYEDFESRQSLVTACESYLAATHDGWVSAQDWEMAEGRHKEMYEMWIEGSKGNAEDEEKARLLWPFPPDAERNGS